MGVQVPLPAPDNISLPMKFDILEKDGFLELVRLSIPKDELKKETALWVSRRQPLVSIPGFRKGKAPIALIQKKYQDTALSESYEQLIKKSVSTVFKEHYQSKSLFKNPIIKKKESTDSDIILDVEFSFKPDISIESLKDIPPFPIYELELSDDEFLAYMEEKFSVKKTLPKIANSEEHVTDDNSVVFYNVEVLHTDGSQVPLKKYFKNIFDFSIMPEHEFLPMNVFMSLKGLKKDDVYETTLALDDKMKEFFSLPDGEIVVKIKIDRTCPLVESHSLDEYLSYANLDKEKFLKDEKAKAISKHQEYIFFFMKKKIFDHMEGIVFDVPKRYIDQEYSNVKKTIDDMKKNEEPSNEGESLSDEEMKRLSERRVRLGILLSEILSSAGLFLSASDVSNFYSKKQNILQGFNALLPFNFNVEAYTQDLNEKNFVSYIIKHYLNNQEPEKISIKDLRAKLASEMGEDILEEIDSFFYHS